MTAHPSSYTGDATAGIDFARDADFGVSVTNEQPLGRIVEMSSIAPTTPNTAAPTLDPRDEKIKQLEDDIQIAQFRAILGNANARRHADRVLRGVQKGTLSFADYKALPDYYQQVYGFQYGIPRDPAVVKVEAAAKAKRKSKRKMQKASRRVNRGK